MKTFAKFGAVAAVAALAAGAVLAQTVAPAADEAEAQAATEARQAIFKQMEDQMNTIAPMMRRQIEFDAEAVAAAATEITALAEMLPEAFAVDTRGFSVETKARNNIWAGYDGFLDRQHALIVALANLKEVAEGGEQTPTLRAVGAVGQACGACHDAHRD